MPEIPAPVHAMLASAQQRTAMQSPEHLVAWLQETGRPFVIFASEDLVRGQAWPDGIDALMHIIAGYRDHRSLQETGRTQKVTDLAGQPVEVPVYKGEPLEKDELDRAIRWLVAQMRALDASWSLDAPAL